MCMYVCMYIYIYIYIKCKILTYVKQCSIHRSRATYCGRKKTNKLPVHPYRPVSWLPTHRGISHLHPLMIYIYISKSDVCFSHAERLGRRMLCKMKGTTVFCWCWPVCSLWWMVGGSSRGGLSSLSSDKASSAIPKSTRRMRIPIHSTTNHPRLTTEKTNNGTTFSGTTPHSAKTSAPISDTDSLP